VGGSTELVEGVDLGRLGEWMDGQGLPKGEIRGVERLGGGTQNILLLFERGGTRYVLRRPPIHKRKNSDETMRREARVLAAIEGSGVPHPRMLAACAEEDVLGASFYLMEPIRGFNPTTELPEPYLSDLAWQRQMGLSMVDGIAALGAVDHEAVGLADFGRPEGYLERQVPRWRRQLESYSALEGYPGPEIPGLEEVADWLEVQRPERWRAGVIHGDFHLANVLFDPDAARLAAIVDWELSTIGDPLLDLGWLLATWPAPGEAGPGFRIGAACEGFATPEELIARYAAQSDRNLSHLLWYEVLACYKLGIIIEGTHARACAGKAPKKVGDMLHARTLGLFARATRRIREDERASS
jgi:aminoglycoside phosphotransferase (APT) family kinase protein